MKANEVEISKKGLYEENGVNPSHNALVLAKGHIMNKKEKDFVFYDVVKNAVNPVTMQPLVNSQGSTMERYNAFRNNKVNYDADSSIEAVVMYKKIFPFINHISEKSVSPQKDKFNRYGLKFELANSETGCGIAFRGDTLNTVATTNREYCKLINRQQPAHSRLEADDIDWPKEALEFIDAYHTPGNFWILPYMEGLSVNCSRGIGSAKDYFDLFLLAIYHYYLGINGRKGKYENITLSKVLNKAPVARFYEMYLNAFINNVQGESEICPCGYDKIVSERKRVLGWNEFIDHNLLQDYVEVNQDGNYGMPKELWEGHFNMFNDTSFAYPKSTSQYMEFWTNATELIRKRGHRIYNILHEEDVNNMKCEKTKMTKQENLPF